MEDPSRFLISTDPPHRLTGAGKQGACNGGWIADGLGWKGGPKDLFLRIALEMHRAVSRMSRLAKRPAGLGLDSLDTVWFSGLGEPRDPPWHAPCSR